MKIYNTLTRKKEELRTIEPGKVKMYVCGPTVYGPMHIGNARSCVNFDAIRRYLEYRNFAVNYVFNFTDVDDKIIKRANDENVASNVISERYASQIMGDLDKLNVKPPTSNPRVTNEIAPIIDMILTLVHKGFAYESNGTVFFSAKKFGDYGKLSKKNISDLEAGARVEVNTNKQDAADFVLWKPAKPGEPSWESPWDLGRPGWHIECSVMAKKYLGDTIDIHGGGEDLIFPHHENEIAQSESANGKPFSSYWMHNGMLNVNNEKMSKSAGNFFTLEDITEKYTFEVIRFFILSAHYRSPLNFSDELLLAAQNSLARIQNCVFTLNHYSSTGEISEDEKSKLARLDNFETSFIEVMDDDFNTANAISVIFDLVKFANIEVSSASSAGFASAVTGKILMFCNILGISTENRNAASVSPEEIENLIEQRKHARANKNFAMSDQIRDELASKGVGIKDTREGMQWFYINSSTH